MTSISTIKKQLSEARAELTALEGDIPKIEKVLSEHRDSYQAARAAGATLDELAEVQAKVSAMTSMLEQHLADTEKARQHITVLEHELSQAQNTKRRDEVASEHAALLEQHRTLSESLMSRIQEPLLELVASQRGLESLVSEGKALGLDLRRVGLMSLVPQDGGSAPLISTLAEVAQRLQRRLDKADGTTAAQRAEAARQTAASTHAARLKQLHDLRDRKANGGMRDFSDHDRLELLEEEFSDDPAAQAALTV